MKNKEIQLLITVLIFLQSCSVKKTEVQIFDEFYKDAESKFLDCIDFGLNNYDQNFDLKDCDLSLKSEIEKRFNTNGINEDGRIWRASLKSTSFNSPILCGYSKKYSGQTDKPIFDKTIYDIISKIDTSIILRNDTLHYEIDIRKTVIYFNCNNNFFDVNLNIKIPNSIKMGEITDSYNREKIKFALNRLKEQHK